MASCKECFHYRVCMDYTSLKESEWAQNYPGSDIICDHYKTTADVEEVKHGEWKTPTTIGGRAFNVPHCSVCNGIPCGVDENTKYCPHCGAKMDGKESEDAK